ncbi:MAG: hypothetical protein Q8P46_03190 [Hyphomicrobiales bacterium]|nr:hypothetical protein [Hyphomicrobiales bacterium]
MSKNTKAERFLKLMDDYLHAKEQLRFAEGLIAHNLMEDISEEHLSKFKDMEETAHADLLEILNDLFRDAA